MYVVVSVTGLCVAWAAFLQAPGPAGMLELPQEDMALMEELRKTVESLPDHRQEAEGLQILLGNVSRFKSEPVKHRVYLSIAQLYRRQGDDEKALVYFEKAGIREREIDDASGIGAISRGHLLDLLEENGDLSGVLERALRYRDGLAVSDLEFAELTYTAGLALIRSGDVDAGVELGIAAAVERPCRDTFESLETLAGDADIHTPNGQSDAGLKAMRWLYRNGGSFGQSARFLSNLSYCEEDSGNISEAMIPLKELIEHDPESPAAARALLRLASLNMAAGDDQAARTYLTQVVDGNGPAEVRNRAKNALELSPDGTRFIGSYPSPVRGSGHILFLAIVHAVLFAGIAVVWWWKKTRSVRT